MSSDIGITNNLAHQRAKSLETLRLAQTEKKSTTEQTSSARTTHVVSQDSVSISAPDLYENIAQIQGFLEDISYGQEIVGTAIDSVNTIIEKLEEVGGLAVRANNVLKSSISPELMTPQVNAFQERTIELSQEITNIVENNGFDGKNLLVGDNISLTGDAKGGFPLKAEGMAISSEDLGLNNPLFGSPEEIEFVKNLVLNAIDQTSLLRSQLNGFSYDLDTRKEFSESTIDAFVAQAQREVGVTNEESEANALQDLHNRTIQNMIASDETLGESAQVELLDQFR
jgi:flagellin-like hook-associated protein FlgL